VKSFAQQNFWLCVLAFDVAHIALPLISGQHIRH